MISIPVAVHNDRFRWQLDLFWHSHRRVYGARADSKALAIIIERNYPQEPVQSTLGWNTDIPHVMCKPFFEHLGMEGPIRQVDLPLNIQAGLAQALPRLHDELVVEVLDCDMLHLRPHPDYRIRDDELVVADLYEPWHLKSLSSHRNVIDIYFQNGGRFYNGGFVPVIGKVRTLRKILHEWTAVHRHILTRDLDPLLHWWAGMYALQAACEKNRVRMLAEDCCYFPGVNALADWHYICHYSVDKRFDKKAWPNVDVQRFEDNAFYARVREWLDQYRLRELALDADQR